MMDKPIYLDYQATTPVDKRVLEATIPFFTSLYANPSSGHRHGKLCGAEVESARQNILSYVNGTPGELVFTSSATEAINLVFSSLEKKDPVKKGHIITQQTEHKAVIESCKALEKSGFKITYLPVDSGGLVSLNQLRESITPTTVLVSIMHVNNEIGTIQPIKEIGKFCKERDILFMVDAAQSAGKLSINVRACKIDYLIVSGHKIYAQKGIAALYSSPEGYAGLSPLFFGGGQENGLRSGTLNVPGIIGLECALKLCLSEMQEEQTRISFLRNTLLDHLTNSCSGIKLNGNLENRIAGNLNICIAGVPNSLLLKLTGKDISYSTGSACLNTSLQESYVLNSIGLTNTQIRNSIRLSIGRFTTEEEISYTGQLLVSSIERIRKTLKN